MKKPYKKKEEKLTSEETELREPVAELEAPATRPRPAEQPFWETEQGKLTGDKYFNLIEHAADGIAIVQDGVIKLANTALIRISGYDREELLGMPFNKVLTPQSQKLTMARYRARMTGKDVPHVYDIKAITKDGEIRDIEVNAALTEYQGRIADEIIIRDITERKRMEEAIKKAEQEKTAILNSMSELVTSQDTEHKMLWTNRAAAESVGMTQEQLVGRHCYEIWPQSNEPCPGCPVTKAGLTGEPQEAETTTPDGRIWHIRAYPTQDSSGSVTGIVEVALEITERKRMEEALKEGEEFSTSLLANSPNPISVINPDTSLKYVNPAFEKLTGFSAAELIGRKAPYPYWLEERHQETKRGFRNAMLHGDKRLELPFKKKNGERFWVETTSTPVKTEGEFKYLLSNWVDITERKKAVEAIRQSEAKYKRLFESSPMGITTMDMKGVITECNPAVYREGGYTAKDLIGKHFSKIAPLRLGDMAKYMKVFSSIIRGKAPKPFEIAYTHKDGTPGWTEVHTRLLKANGKNIGIQVLQRDVTERKLAEQALADEATRRRILIEQSRDGIVILDQTGKVYEANQQFAEMLGYTPAETSELHVWDWDTQWTREQLLEKIQSIGEAGDHVETCHRRKDGTIIDVEISINGAVFAGQKLAFCVCRDITERKKAEEKLQTILKTALDGFWLTNLEGKILEVNDSYCQMIGYTREELLKMSTQDLEAVESPEEVAQHIKRLFKKGYDSFVSQHKRKDGRIIDVEISVNYLDVGEGQIFVFARDITERKQAEKALRESQKFSSGLLESSPNPIFVLNPDTSIRYVNPAFEKLTDFTLAEISESKAPHAWWPQEYREEMLAGLKEAMATGGRKSERIFQKKNGERFWVALNSAPVMHDGKLIYFLIIWIDITERKRAEEREQELQRELHISSRLAAIGELAAGIAHQINNPLTGVLGFSQRLLKKSTDPETNQDLKRIYSEAERAAKVVQNLLTFARRRQPHKEYSDINEILESALELRAYELTTSNIEVITDLAPKLPELMLDFYQIQEVFLNIILNAEQAMTEAHSGGKLTIMTVERRGYIRTTFTDTGPGISPEDLEKIFDPFFTTKGKRGGTGLGLSVCHGIVTEHGSRIYAKSKPGKGATFFVELPLPAH